jgi:outer membrane protein assembly factor BamA
VKGGVQLSLRAEDKLSWIIAPTAYFQPGNTGGGLGYGENNLWGENKKLLLYGQIATADSLFLGVFLVPSISGTRFFWRVDTLLRHSKVTEFNSPQAYLGQPIPERVSYQNYLNGGMLLGVNLARDFSFYARLRGARVFFRDAQYADGFDPTTDPMLPPMAREPETDGWDVSAEVRLTYDGRASWNGVSEGRVFGMGFERSVDFLGSDYDYWVGSAKYEIYKKILTNHNLVWRTGVAVGHHLPFQQELAAGGTDLRGYQNAEFRGDFKASSRLEYSFQLFWIGPLAFRMLGFWDSAYTTFLQSDDNPQRDYLPGQTDNNINRWRNGVGGGFRVYVKAIVLPLLGVDVGYGLEANDYHVYLALGLTEL